MPQLNFTEVLTFSSEDPNHPADNLLKSDTYLKWKSESGRNEKQEYVVLKFEKLSSIRSLDIGNENSAFIEVLVSREEGDFKVLLVASSFMSPLESRNGTNTNRVRMFGSDKLNKSVAEQKWDRIKIICTQPFIKNVQYGLTFVKVNGPEEKNTDDHKIKLGKFTILEEEEDDELPSIGSFFAKRKEKDSPLTGAAAIRAASKMATQSPEQKKVLKRSAEENNSNAPDIGFYQLKKKVKESQDSDGSLTPKMAAKTPEQTKALKRSGAENTSDDSNTVLNQIKKKIKDKDRSASPSSKSETENQKLEAKKSSDSNSTKHRDKKSDKTTAPNSSKTPKQRATRPFNKLMNDVVFVMSGYQNPQRSNLRDSLIEMGAKYKGDWGNDCTHLICAFRNTPKFQAVKGKGKIVTEKWVEDCYKKKIRFPWRRYNLEKNRSDESEDEIWASEICSEPQNGSEGKATDKLRDTDEMLESEDTDDEIERAIQKNKQISDKAKSPNQSREEKTKKQNNGDNSKSLNQSKEEKMEKPNNSSHDKSIENKSTPKQTSDDEYDADTDVDEDNKIDTTGLPLPPLKNIFKERIFFIYGSHDESKKKSLIRYITAFQGKISTYMNEDVTYVITDDSWDENFDNALEDNSNLQFVKSQWIWKCCNSEKMVPPQPFLIVPKDES